jgi:hypothetical protein
MIVGTIENLCEIELLKKKNADLQAKLTHYQEAEKEGRLLALPCSVGDTIYVIPSEVNIELNSISHPENNRVYQQVVSSVEWYCNDRYLLKSFDGLCVLLSDSFGITWFLDRAAAEAAIKGKKNELFR